jgi:leucyl aminopeptidase
LNKKIQEKSLELKDRVRELPFYEPYFKAYRSDIADMNNIHSRSSGTPGTVGAALFLSQFISMENWVHIDIAGPSSISNDPISGGGATACMMRLMIYRLEHN